MRKSTNVILTLAAVVLCGAFLTGCSAKARMARHRDRADKYFAEGSYAKAEIEYRIATRLDPNNAHSISRLGEIYFEQGRFRLAFPYTQRASELLTNDIDLHVKLGTIYIMAQMPKEARVQAEFVLDRSPTNAEAPDILAESVASHTDFNEVKARLDKLSKQIGETAPLELAYAIIDYAGSDIKGAEAALQRALTIDPKFSNAYYTLGNLYFHQNKLKEADEAFKKAADLSPLRSPRRLSYANFKIQTGDLAEGKRLMAEITKQTPDYIPAWLRQAEIALAEKRFDDCESMINQTVAKDPDNYDALVLRGRLYLMQGKPDKAVAELDRISALYDRAPDVQFLLAQAHLGVNDTTKAVADLNKALFLRPIFPEATLLLAQINLNKGDATSTITAMNQLVRQQPNSVDGYLLLGMAYSSQKNYDKALDAYAKVAELIPKSPQVPFLTGMALVQKKNIVEARKYFEKALELSPKFTLALEELVNLDMADQKYDAALDRVNKTTDENIGVARELLLAKIYMGRAQSLANKEAKLTSGNAKLNVPVAQDDVNKAEAALNKAIEMAPNSDTAYSLLARLYVAAGKEQAALDRLNALVSKTNNPLFSMQIGTIYESLKDYPKARDAYEKVLAAVPDSSTVLNNLSYIYAEHLGDLEKAQTLAEKARQLASKDPSTADTLGWVLFKKGDYTRARPLLEESAAKLSGQGEVEYHVGMVRYMLDDEAGARTALQDAVSSSDEFSGKEEAARRLAVLNMNVSAADAKAKADLEKRLADEPSDPVVASRLGAIYERDGTLDKAAKIYEASLKQNPQNFQIMSRLARIYVSLNQPDKAMEVGKDAHKLVPDDATISSLLGRLAFQSGDYPWAANLLQEAAPRLPNRPDVQYDLAWSYYTMGKVPEAERTMQSVVATLTAERQADAKQFLAMLAAVKAPTPTTAAQAAQIINANSNYVPAIMVSAAQAEQQNKGDDAIKLYTQVLAKYPAFAPAARNLAILVAENPGDDQKAYDVGVKARTTTYPDDAPLGRALGVLAYRRGDYSRAAQLLQESSLTLTSDGELFFYLGMAQYQLKHMPQSKVALQHALTLKIQPKPADDARKVLAELK